MAVSDEILIETSYVQISTYRTKVIQSLNNKIKIPTQIAKDTGIKTNHISKVLSDLKAHKLIECINEEVRKGRLYRLTPKGNQVLKEMKR